MALEFDDYRSHDRVAELLPWYLNGTLDAAESGLVERHLAVCLTCRTTIERERQLASVVLGAAAEQAAENAAFDQLVLRMAREPRQRARRRRVFAVAAGLAVLAVGLAVLGAFDHSDSAVAPPYRTLSRAEKVTGADQLRVVFVSGTGAAARKAVLDAHTLEIVAGPGSSGTYTVAPRNGEPAASLLVALRAEPRILFAEPALIAPRKTP